MQLFFTKELNVEKEAYNVLWSEKRKWQNNMVLACFCNCVYVHYADKEKQN